MDTRVKQARPISLTWNGGLTVTTKARAKSRAGNAGSKSYCVRRKYDANAVTAVRIGNEHRANFPKGNPQSTEIGIRKSGMSLREKKERGII